MAIAFVLLVLLAGPAWSQNVICDHVQPPLRTFGLVADQVVTKLTPSGDPGNPWPTDVYRLACTRRAKLAGTTIDPTIVATESDSTAIRFTHGTIAFSTCWNAVYGDIVTGGGAVTGIDPICVDGTVDTSGTNPLVADCNQAFTDRQTVSDFYASQPPSRDLGSITVAAFDTYTLDLAPNEVVHFDSITVKGGYDPEFRLLCYGYTDVVITGGPGIVNVDDLDIGPCSTVHIPDAAVLLNVPGSGHPVKMGRGAVVVPPILAPLRTMSVRGTVDDGITFIGSTFVRRLKMTGFSSLEHLFPSCP